MDKPPADSGDIHWDDAGQPSSKHFDDVYFSRENGLQETRYVFLQGNQLTERFPALKANEHFSIFETGFGTGLNFLATWALWEKHISEAACLEFISVEKFPLSKYALEKALSLWPELEAYTKALLANYPPQPWSGVHRIEFQSKHGSRILLTLYCDDVKNAIDTFSSRSLDLSEKLNTTATFGEHTCFIDAWFLDGFAPAKNPDMWSNKLFETMAINSHHRSTFATFTAAGVVRRGLQSVGFSCKKIPGFGRKREMLIGQFYSKDKNEDAKHSRRSSLFSQSELPSWALNQARTKKVNSAIIIGAGLAGAHLAFTLAQRNIQVTVLEKNTLASGASSNFQGAIYSRLSASRDPLSDFNKQAQIYADHFYQSENLFERCGDACGVLHLCSSEKDEQRLKGFSALFPQSEKFRFLTQKEASQRAQLSLKHEALFIENSGWLHPQKLCTELLKHKNITLIENQFVEGITQDDKEGSATWQAHTPTHSYSAATCIICNAADALDFEQSAHLPIKSIRGQVSHCESNEHLRALKTVICGEGYLCPAAKLDNQSIHSLGATFNLRDNSTELNDADHQTNLDALNDIIDQKNISKAMRIANTHSGNVGFRSTSPDYFPLVGPLPKLTEIHSRFAKLSKNANARIDDCGAYYPGLYCSLAYGSRGLAYTPLTSALLADLITGAFLPVSKDLYTHLHPARFAIRALIKNKPYGSI